LSQQNVNHKKNYYHVFGTLPVPIHVYAFSKQFNLLKYTRKDPLTWEAA